MLQSASRYPGVGFPPRAWGWSEGHAAVRYRPMLVFPHARGDGPAFAESNGTNQNASGADNRAVSSRSDVYGPLALFTRAIPAASSGAEQPVVRRLGGKLADRRHRYQRLPRLVGDGASKPE